MSKIEIKEKNLKSLKSLQENFIEGLKKEELPSFILNPKFIPQRELWEIYRRNHFYPLFESLKDTYPCCYYLLGEKNFFSLSQNFMTQYPSRDPLLLDYGKDFPSFLEDEAKKGKELQTLPFLLELAKWELLVKRGSLLSEGTFGESPPKDSQQHKKSCLEILREEADSNILLQRSRACLLFHSRRPILELWRELTHDIEESENENEDKDMEETFTPPSPMLASSQSVKKSVPYFI